GRRIVGRVGIVVGRGDHVDDALADRVEDGGVERGAGRGDGEAHVGDGRSGGAERCPMGVHQVDPGDDARNGAVVVAVQHPGGNHPDVLGDAVGPAADDTGDVSAVAVAVVVGLAVGGADAEHAAPALRVQQ